MGANKIKKKKKSRLFSRRPYKNNFPLPSPLLTPSESFALFSSSFQNDTKIIVSYLTHAGRETNARYNLCAGGRKTKNRTANGSQVEFINNTGRGTLKDIARGNVSTNHSNVIFM